MESISEFVAVEVKEEPIDNKVSSTTQQPSLVDSMSDHSEDPLSQCDEIGIKKEDDVCIKDEPVEDLDPLSTSTTFVPTLKARPRSTRVKSDFASYSKKKRQAVGGPPPTPPKFSEHQHDSTCTKMPTPPSSAASPHPAARGTLQKGDDELIGEDPPVTLPSSSASSTGYSKIERGIRRRRDTYVMASKRPATTTAAEIKAKRPRKSLSLEKKLQIVKRHEGGEGANSIARFLQLPQSTVSTIIKQAASVKKAGQTASTLMAKTLTRQREPIMEEMERLLRLWIDDQTRCRLPLSTSLVTSKALSIYAVLQKKGYEVKEGSTFSASKGWFDRFKTRAALHNIKMSGEAASSNEPAAAAFKPTLKKHIEECGYSAKQVINYSDTGMYWKKMSSRTFIAKEEKTAPGFKASKDRLTLVLGGNAAGDLKLKPLMIYRSENPRALKGYVKEYLPVIYRFNNKAWMTSSINQHYVANYLSPALRDYATKENIVNRFLLLVDNAPSHPTTMEDWADNIEVMFLPKNTTAIIQPMDQGVIDTFKAYYQRRTMTQLINTTDSPDRPTIKQFWANYNIKKAIDNIDAAWKEVTEKTMNGCWKKLWAECVKPAEDLTGCNDVAAIRKDIVRLSHLAGFKEVDEDNVNELLQSHDEPLTNEDLMELDQERALHGDDDDDDDDDEPQRGLDIKTLGEVFAGLDAIIEKIKEKDPNPARSGTVAHSVEQAFKVYKEIFEAKKKMARQTSFFKPAAASSPADPDSPPPSSTHDTPPPVSSTSGTLPSTAAAQDSSSPATSDDEEQVFLGFN